jgi:hypothetical protein
MTNESALATLRTLAHAELRRGGIATTAGAAHEWQQGFLAGLECALAIPRVVRQFRRRLRADWRTADPSATELDLITEARRVVGVFNAAWGARDQDGGGDDLR